MKWGILATGTVAVKFAKTVAAMCTDDEKIVAVGSRDKKKAREFADTYGINKAYGSYEELAADPEAEPCLI